MKNIVIKVAVLTAAGLFSASAFAKPFELADAQMDSVAAGGQETTSGFICPVISTENVLHAKNGAMINGAYTVAGPDVMVPLHATNTLDDGTSGSPGGTFASPGDTGYTAIWSR